MSVESVVIAVDGESKCGKTTVIETIAAEASYQAGIVPGILEPGNPAGWDVDVRTRAKLTGLQEAMSFNTITTISAGNTFRAATLHVALLELSGQSKSEFREEDHEHINEIMRIPAINEVLQSDPNIGLRVNIIAKMAGAQALCGSMTGARVLDAYHQNGGGNLVVADFRDPLGTMIRHNVIGESHGQVSPASVMPIYVETPTEVAAKRMGGNFNDRLVEVATRRLMDSTRKEHPVMRPSVMLEDFGAWLDQFQKSVNGELALPYLLYNGEGVSLENVQHTAGMIAAMAQNLAYTLSLEP